MTKDRTNRHLVRDYFWKTRSLCAFSLCPQITDRKVWDGLSTEVKELLTAQGEKAQKEPWSVILLSNYTEFSKSGNRESFEVLYFSRRRKLCSLVMAECVENKGRFIEDILDGLYLILEESSWCLPAHNTHVRDAVQEEMPDVLHPVIDLFDAETGALVAVLEYMLRPILKKRSPFISDYVNRRLMERIFDPYTSEHFWWMGDGRQSMCNWTPWCTQNVLLCVLSRPEGFFEEKEIRSFLESASVSLDYFLDEYGDDGCCNEGAQYYSHAGLCLFGALYLMDDVLDKEAFEPVFKESLIKNIAAYIVRMNVRNNIYINFADCAAVCPRRTAREYLFGKLCGDEVLSAFAASDFRSGTVSERLVTDEINLFYHVLQALCYEEMERCPEPENICDDFFFESTGLMVSRDSTYILAAKAGNNADSHNHNDVGSFTLYKNGRPFIIDLGVGTYTRQTFSERRYELWTMQSQFHNVPMFIKDNNIDYKCIGKDAANDYHNSNIVMQKDGAAFRSENVECRLHTNGENAANSGNRLSMDIAKAYGDSSVVHYLRKITHIKDEGIEILDEYEGEATALLTLMTYEKPEEISGVGEGSFVRIGDLGEVSIHGGRVKEMQSFPIEDERLGISWKHEVYRILIEIGEDKSVRIGIR